MITRLSTRISLSSSLLPPRTSHLTLYASSKVFLSLSVAALPPTATKSSPCTMTLQSSFWL